jgi:peptidoglycan/xylan/chitin deacetylase (PgdA/CDA1 family)
MKKKEEKIKRVYKNPIPSIIIGIIFTHSSVILKAQSGSTDLQALKQVIIFKFDDLTERSQYAFQRVAEIVILKDCKAGFGIIAKSCEDNGEKEAYYNRVKNFVNTERIEIWAHGYDHFLNGVIVTEFLTMPYQHQYEHFKKSLDLVSEKCGITMRSFGAPGNRSDSTTISVINQFPQIEVFLLPFFSDSTNKQLLLTSRVNMEKGTGNMDYDYFVNNYNANADRPYMILQGHPGVWKEEGFDVFARIIDFLKTKGVTFMTSYEYFEFLKS